MKFKDFLRKNNHRPIRCKCCAFCVWFKSEQYDFGGHCTHPDITGDEERYCANVYELQICDKFSEVN